MSGRDLNPACLSAPLRGLPAAISSSPGWRATWLLYRPRLYHTLNLLKPANKTPALQQHHYLRAHQRHQITGRRFTYTTAKVFRTGKERISPGRIRTRTLPFNPLDYSCAQTIIAQRRWREHIDWFSSASTNFATEPYKSQPSKDEGLASEEGDDLQMIID